MSTMTRERLPLDRGVQTPLPERDILRAQLQPQPEPKAMRLSATSQDAIATGPPRLVLEREEDGTYLISSCDGVVAGVGPTPPEALYDFWQELRSRVRYLRENRARLHGNMVADLQSLERDFPWV